MGDWYSWEHGRFAFYSQRFDPAILHQLKNAVVIRQRTGLRFETVTIVCCKVARVNGRPAREIRTDGIQVQVSKSCCYAGALAYYN